MATQLEMDREARRIARVAYEKHLLSQREVLGDTGIRLYCRNYVYNLGYMYGAAVCDIRYASDWLEFFVDVLETDCFPRGQLLRFRSELELVCHSSVSLAFIISKTCLFSASQRCCNRCIACTMIVGLTGYMRSGKPVLPMPIVDPVVTQMFDAAMRPRVSLGSLSEILVQQYCKSSGSVSSIQLYSHIFLCLLLVLDAVTVGGFPILPWCGFGPPWNWMWDFLCAGVQSREFVFDTMD